MEQKAPTHGKAPENAPTEVPTMVPREITDFLGCATSEAWCQQAVDNLEILLIDHAQCEHKAASTAMHLIFRYPEHNDLLFRMSRLAREELRHFEQVLSIMKRRGIAFQHQTAARYAAGLRKRARGKDPERLVDLLIVGAFIEARSCERFAVLIPWLDDELAKFYQGLLASESRHFRHYLRLAQTLSDKPIEDRVALFRGVEAELIDSPDSEFRFHSGRPAG